MNHWIKTAQWVSRFGKKRSIRDDPFAHGAIFEYSSGGYDYEVVAQITPYGGERFKLQVKKDSDLVCKYHYPGDGAEISIGTGWIRN